MLRLWGQGGGKRVAGDASSAVNAGGGRQREASCACSTAPLAAPAHREEDELGCFIHGQATGCGGVDATRCTAAAGGAGERQWVSGRWRKPPQLFLLVNNTRLRCRDLPASLDSRDENTALPPSLPTGASGQQKQRQGSPDSHVARSEGVGLGEAPSEKLNSRCTLAQAEWRGLSVMNDMN